MFVFITQLNSTDREDHSALPIAAMPSNLKRGYCVDLTQETGAISKPKL
jgi:hypothetical protein